MTTTSVCRLSMMVGPVPGTSPAALAQGLRDRRAALTELVADRPGGYVRLGTRLVNDPLAQSGTYAPVDAAVELTMAEADLRLLASRAGAFGDIMRGLADPATSAVTIGITHQMVPPRDGGIFLSLSFKRTPGTTVEEFRRWWYHQHAPLAIRLLEPELLGYDQVHVDHALARQASLDAGINYIDYDSYDNLTWASVDSFVQCVSKPGFAETIYNDEVGHLDHSTNRGSLMDVLR